jgi:hypothetical protein
LKNSSYPEIVVQTFILQESLYKVDQI